MYKRMCCVCIHNISVYVQVYVLYLYAAFSCSVLCTQKTSHSHMFICILLQRYCCSDIVAAILLQRYCCSDIVAAILLQSYYCSDIVAAILLQ